MTQELLIRINGQQAAVARVEDRRLNEIFLPSQKTNRLVGNIYLGEVENVLPGMQAAFIDIGLERNSFLYVEDALLPAYHEKKADEALQITDMVKKGQQVVVQIFKEPSGSKGARVTMYPSLPGRYLVLLPFGNYVAVSRRIEDEGDRERLKQLMHDNLPDNMGAIVRTVAQNADESLLAADLKALLKEWRYIQSRSAKMTAPALLHNDSDLLSRVIRDTNPEDIDHIVTANSNDYQQVSELIASIAPGLQEKLLVRESSNLFLDYDIYAQMEKALERKVWLKSGGYIIIDQTEALCSIDVNTGKYVGENNLNDTVFKTNMEALNEIARQLVLRNIGGIVIIDFIDMKSEEDKEKLMSALEERMKHDRIRVTVMGMTQLGLVELTRKKIGHDLSTIVEHECERCHGKGRIADIKRLLAEE